MADYIKTIRTTTGDKQIDYEALANKPITEGTCNGQLVANASAQSNLTVSQVRNIYAGTEDLTAGTSELATGVIYLVYEG